MALIFQETPIVMGDAGISNILIKVPHPQPCVCLQTLELGSLAYCAVLIYVHIMFYCYIMTNKPNGTLYIGHTEDLAARVWEHKQRAHPRSFTARYNLDKLVWYDEFDGREAAAAYEARMKKWRRAWKIEEIERYNPGWKDLYFAHDFQDFEVS